MSRTTEATRAQGTSLKTVDRRIVIGATRAATPTMSRALKILLPTTLPTARSGVPLRAETTLTQSSGMEVPRATMVSPMTIWGTRSRSATATAPSVSRSAPQRTSTTPTTIHKAFSNILFFLFYFYFFNDVFPRPLGSWRKRDSHPPKGEKRIPDAKIRKNPECQNIQGSFFSF